MKPLLSVCLVGGVALVLQTTWLAHWPSTRISLDLVGLLFLFLALRSGEQPTWSYVLLLGLLRDATSYSPWGSTAVTYFLIYCLIHWSLRRITLQSPLAQFVWVAAGSFSVQLLGRGLLFLLIPSGPLVGTDFFWNAGQAVWDGGISLLLFPFFKRVLCS